MKRLFFHLIALCLAGSALVADTATAKQTRVVPMPDLMRPYAIYTDDQQLYIIDESSVYIYRKPDYRLLTYNLFKDGLMFPEYFPAIKSLEFADGRIYVETYRMTVNKQVEFFIFGVNGVKEKRLFLPLNESLFEESTALYTIKDNTLFELVENLEKEEMELHITPIDMQ